MFNLFFKNIIYIMNYKFVIKSKDRVEKFRKMTYHLLKNYNIEDSNIYIFVSYETDLQNYKKNFPNCNIILGDSGIVGIDNFIVDYFEENEEYIYMNDDITKIYKCIDRKTLKILSVNEFYELINELFTTMKKNQYTYAGVYPVDNPYFICNVEQITTNLCIIIDGFSACINNKNIRLTKFKLSETVKDNYFSDYEKSILHFINSGIIRFNKYCFTGEFFGKGISERTQELHKINAELMLKKYSKYISSIKSKKDGWNSLRLKKIKK